ncbi:MAG: amidohydrolase family protein [bacterium]|nr:amidohydrolase family protein [bacterium]
MSGPSEAVVDSHVHFWDPGNLHYDWLEADAALQRTFLPDDLTDTGGFVRGIIAVQADCDAEQSVDEVAWLEELARRGAPIIGIVARAALERGTQAEDEVASHASQQLVVGIRRLLQDEDKGFALAPDFVDGVRLLARHGLVMDLCVRAHQISEATALVERCPDVTFVLDHLGKPQVGTGSTRVWAHDLALLAAFPNAHCKLSGLSSELGGDPNNARHLPAVLEVALEAFGPQRCMFGSDWPVSSLTVDYLDWLGVVDTAVAHLTDSERQDVMSRTALRVYARAARPKTMVAS